MTPEQRAAEIIALATALTPGQLEEHIAFSIRAAAVEAEDAAHGRWGAAAKGDAVRAACQWAANEALERAAALVERPADLNYYGTDTKRDTANRIRALKEYS